jgi:HK97 family phage major capsid protein
MNKKFYEKRLKKLQAKKEELRKKALASDDVNEVRDLSERIEELNEDIADIKEALADLEAIVNEDKDAEAKEEENRSNMPVSANAHVPAGATKVTFRSTPVENKGIESMEYRSAFMNYVQNGTPIPAEFRDVISTADTGAAIPTTVMNNVINTVRKRYGNLYNKVTKTSVRGGVEIPVGALQATFSWINETTVSERKKVGKLGKVIFAYNTAEIRIAQTFLSQLLTVDSFETRLAEIIAVAYLQAMDEGIVKGSGEGSMLGILNDPRVTNEITLTAEQIGSWKDWRKRFFAKLPLGYRGGEFIFPVSTVDAYLETMSDTNQNPIFQQATGLVVNDGDAVNPNGRFFGRDISLVEPDIIADFDTASAGDVIGIYWQPEEYVINENFGFTMRRYFDEETNEWVDKALVVVDGKVVNPTGYYKIIKG